MSLASDHFLTAEPNPLRDYLNRCSCYDQGANSVVSKRAYRRSTLGFLAFDVLTAHLC
jgi:hypothetical protein